jgi:hypothetical protein
MHIKFQGISCPNNRRGRVQKWQELLTLHNKDPKIFFARLVTGDESKFHNQTPEVNRQSMQW